MHGAGDGFSHSVRSSTEQLGGETTGGFQIPLGVAGGTRGERKSGKRAREGRARQEHRHSALGGKLPASLSPALVSDGVPFP